MDLLKFWFQQVAKSTMPANYSQWPLIFLTLYFLASAANVTQVHYGI